MSGRAFNLLKNRGPVREIVLEKIPGKLTKDSAGMTDDRLWTGGNKLFGIMDTESTLWHAEYEKGQVPIAFQQQFTNFPKLLKFVTDYYIKRNIQVTKVIE